MGRPHLASHDMEHDYGRAVHHGFNSSPNGIFAFLLSTFCLLLAHRAFAMTPLVLSPDTGIEIEDQWAVGYSLTNHHVHVKVPGVVAGHTATFCPCSSHQLLDPR